MRIPYFRQQQRHTCGPAALRMVLAAAGTLESEERIAELAGTIEAGTLSRQLASAAIQLGHRSEYKEGLSTKDLEKWLRRGPAILMIDPHWIYAGAAHSAHFVVVSQIRKGTITIHDPDRGPFRMFDLTEFESAWAVRGRQAVRIWA